MLYIEIMRHDSDITEKKIPSLVITRMDHEGLPALEISLTEKDKNHRISFTWRISKQTNSQTQGTDWWSLVCKVEAGSEGS